MDGLRMISSALQSVVDAQGLIVCWRDELYQNGVDLPKEFLQKLQDFLIEEARPPVWAIDHLVTRIPEAAEYVDKISGVMAVQLGVNASDLMILCDHST